MSSHGMAACRETRAQSNTRSEGREWSLFHPYEPMHTSCDFSSIKLDGTNLERTSSAHARAWVRSLPGTLFSKTSSFSKSHLAVVIWALPFGPRHP
ncbi:hypothetical protein VNO77_43984 [Canavalia gladiata]|uniref:Uncharacterized protein n=1 Tax=Canavalia gladiata TaxID=3824 RepID=A0AAN9PND7_CANGL